MNENINEFIWDLASVTVFILGITVLINVFIVTNRQWNIYKMHQSRSIFMTEDDLLNNYVERNELISLLYNELEFDITIDESNYYKGEIYKDISIVKSSKYYAKRIIDETGNIVKIVFVSR